jgi:hypothetical protein
VSVLKSSWKTHFLAMANRVRSATSVSAQQLPACKSIPSIPQNNVNMMSAPAGQFNKQPGYRPSFARNEQQVVNGQHFDNQVGRQILKQMVDDQNAGKVTNFDFLKKFIYFQILGSSPEIHNVGTRNPANSHFMRRAQSNARGFPNNTRAANYSDEKVSQMFFTTFFKIRVISAQIKNFLGVSF